MSLRLGGGTTQDKSLQKARQNLQIRSRKLPFFYRHKISPQQKNTSRVWVFPKIGVPENGWFIVENPIKMDDLGVPYFWKYPAMHKNIHCFSGVSTKLLGGSPQDLQVVSNHGDRFRPPPGVANPFHTAFLMAYTWGWS